MNKSLVFGHKNPDTDAIGAAIAFSYLQNQLGHETEAVALGEPSEETAYALNHFGFKAPRVIETAADEVESVMLVDHNEFQQSVEDIEEVTILSVVDHHKIDNFETSEPLYFRSEPLGSTSTIVTKLFKENSVDIPQNIAGIMLSAIISDTLLLQSPTCTDVDVETVKELAEIAEVNYEEYGLDMLKAGADVSSMSSEEILEGDAKSFEMGEVSVRIGQVNVVDVDDVLKRKEALIGEMNRLATASSYGLYFLVITNILTNDSKGLVVGNSEVLEAVSQAFDHAVVRNEIELPGVVSRKKQVVPQLTKAIEEL